MSGELDAQAERELLELEHLDAIRLDSLTPSERAVAIALDALLDAELERRTLEGIDATRTAPGHA